MPTCYHFRALASADAPAVLAIDEEIGFWGTQAKEFREQLNAVQGNALRVEINSPGGDFFAALGIYHMLRAWAAGAGRSLTTRVVGLAASAAGVIALAADRREMLANSFAMIHGVSGEAWGSADDMRETADLVDKIQANLRGIYMERMGIGENEVTAMMEGDTWLAAQEALECGFATHVLDAQRITARFDWARCAAPAHVVHAFVRADATQGNATQGNAVGTQAAAVMALAQQAGLAAHAKYLALACATLDEARQRVTHALETVTLCQLAGNEDKATDFIRAHAPLTDVRAALLQNLSDADVHTDNAPISKGGSDAAALNPYAI